MAEELTGLRVISFEARRAQELAIMLARHGATVVQAPALRETPLERSDAALTCARRLARGDVHLLILLTGVGTRALAAAVAKEFPDFAALLAKTQVIARGPKPLAALRAFEFTAARAVAEPHTWREVLTLVDGLGLPGSAHVAVQEYGQPAAALVSALEQRGYDVLRVPLYRWALPDDTGPLHDAARCVAAAAAEVAVFTNSAQVDHLFRVCADADELRRGFTRIVIASVGPVCSEALEAHGVKPDLEASPPKMGPLVALIAAQARALLRHKRSAAC